MIPPNYSQSYLNGNVELQQAIEEYHRNCIRQTVTWLAASAAFFTLLLFSIVFESNVLIAYALIQLCVCSVTVNDFCTIPKAIQ